jgi:hypothetical protein
MALTEVVVVNMLEWEDEYSKISELESNNYPSDDDKSYSAIRDQIHNIPGKEIVPILYHFGDIVASSMQSWKWR